MKFVFILFMLPLADQGENLQNFTSFCRTIIEVQEISGKAQFKAWKSPHLFGNLVGISEGLPAFCTLSRSRRQQGQQHNFGNQKERSSKKIQGQILNSFKRRIWLACCGVTTSSGGS